jgi:competence protein ComGC
MSYQCLIERSLIRRDGTRVINPKMYRTLKEEIQKKGQLFTVSVVDNGYGKFDIIDGNTLLLVLNDMELEGFVINKKINAIVYSKRELANKAKSL